MKTKEYWINNLKLEKHPEGGFYKETYRSNVEINVKRVEGSRNISTGIYFLIEAQNFSAFHRIKSDEMWHFYAGDPLVVHMIDESGNYSKQVVGRNFERNELLQFVVPANTWFASEVIEGGSFSLVGCTVSFGFDFRDFELADKNLAQKYPIHSELITRLIHKREG